MTLRSELHEQELVAVKEGGSPEALRAEAALLADLDHPGIVRFVALTDDERGLRLLTRYAGRQSLATWRPQRLEELRRAIEEIAETVCYLHEHRIVHRSVRPANVVIDSLCRPLLCGFSAARRHTGGEVAEHLADVRAIGETALAVLRRLETNRSRPRLRRHEQRLRQRIQAVAQAAADGRVPSSRALASRLRAAATEIGGSGPAAGFARAGSRRANPMARGPGSSPAAAASGTEGVGGVGGDRHAHDATTESHPLLRAGGSDRVEPPSHAPLARPPSRGSLRRPGRPRQGVSSAVRPVPRRPRRTSWLAAATVCAGCVLGALMVLRLGDRNTTAPPLPASTPASVASGSASPARPQAVAPVRATAAIPAATPVEQANLGSGSQPPEDPQAGDAAPEAGPRVGPEQPAESADPPGRATAGAFGSTTGVGAAPGSPKPPDDEAAGCREPVSGRRDVDGDGCAEEIRVVPGFVSVDGIRYPVGAADDQVAVGDWDCDGIATVALVQPTGQVYLFEAWPQHEPLGGTLVAELPPPVELAGITRGSCTELTVRYREGTWFLPLPAAAG